MFTADNFGEISCAPREGGHRKTAHKLVKKGCHHQDHHHKPPEPVCYPE
jgi:hypothetical protein